MDKKYFISISIISIIVITIVVVVICISKSNKKSYSDYNMMNDNTGDVNEISYSSNVEYFSNNDEFISSISKEYLSIFQDTVPDDIKTQVPNLTFINIDSDGTVHGKTDYGYIDFVIDNGEYIIIFR